MGNIRAIKALYLLLALVPLIFTDCAKDTCKRERTITMYTPIYKTKDEVRNEIKRGPARDIERPGKIYILGNTIFLNEIDKGIHIIDNTNPSNPVKTGFINIPGNLDIAAKGNILYADLYTDIVTLDISNPSNIAVKKITENVFPYRIYGNGFVADNSASMIIVDWVRKDTVVKTSCENDVVWALQSMNSGVFFSAGMADAAGGGNIASLNSSAPTGAGTGGSMARFTIVNNHLYTVGMSMLDVFDISNTSDPQRGNSINAGWLIETIYPFKDKLFIGSQQGMFIYNISNPANPQKEGQFTHARSCDPVIADGNYAYVTLRSGTECQGFTNQLDVVKISNIADPVLEKTYPFTNPHGLSKDGNLLFICDGNDGVKVYNASNVSNLQPIKTIGNIMAFDIILMNKVAMVIGDDGLYQYDYTDINNIRLLSKIVIKK
jgi:hypothetical protein